MFHTCIWPLSSAGFAEQVFFIYYIKSEREEPGSVSEKHGKQLVEEGAPRTRKLYCKDIALLGAHRHEMVTAQKPGSLVLRSSKAVTNGIGL